jgi:hypothetical protein
MYKLLKPKPSKIILTFLLLALLTIQGALTLSFTNVVHTNNGSATLMAQPVLVKLFRGVVLTTFSPPSAIVPFIYIYWYGSTAPPARPVSAPPFYIDAVIFLVYGIYAYVLSCVLIFLYHRIRRHKTRFVPPGSELSS